jgi:hypothetical protein
MKSMIVAMAFLTGCAAQVETHSEPADAAPPVVESCPDAAFWCAYEGQDVSLLDRCMKCGPIEANRNYFCCNVQ